MSHVKDLEAFLDAQTPEVQRSVKIVTPKDLGQDYLMHISTATSIPKFVPCIGQRHTDGENRTVPRICVGPTILGCFIGYQAAMDDFEKVADGKTDGDWKGGWKIYGFEFEAALNPNRRMVIDTHVGDEHWLVSYNEDTREYVPKNFGRAFLRSVRSVARSGQLPTKEIEMLVEVKREDGLPYSKNIYLKRGYWRIDGPGFLDVKNLNDDGDYRAVEITKEEFMSAKAASADLLGFKLEVPAFAKW